MNDDTGSSVVRVKINRELELSVRAYAEREDRTMSSTIRYALMKLLEQDGASNGR